ncbi:hypothetical protein EDB19DRAFT_1756269 [Suillus lakei]|nr:hypothetical protein EDB19DRAFT_1756269 [Suillus lakei]
MQTSTTSPSAVMHSTDIDRVASQYNPINQTTTDTYTLDCGRHGCPVVFVYKVGTDWPTVSRLIKQHSPICTGGLYELPLGHPPSDTWSAQDVLTPPQLTPVGPGAHNDNCDNKATAPSRQRNTEGERREGLERDRYTENVRPTSVRCRGCGKDICLDKRSRYYPGLWLKHRGKCPGILRMEQDDLARMERGVQSTRLHPVTASSFDTNGEDSDEEDWEEDDVVTNFNSKSVIDGSKHYDSPGL